MNRSTRRLLAVCAVLAALACASIAGAAPGDIFNGASTTAAGLTTWDSDMTDTDGVAQTGAGVYVAVLDTGLTPDWQSYFPASRVRTDLATGFNQSVTLNPTDDPCNFTATVGNLQQSTWIGSSSTTHGTHVMSTILGYAYDSHYDAASGFDVAPFIVRGIAPGVTAIPVKVLGDYEQPALPNCTDPDVDTSAHTVNFGTDEMIAAGIAYATRLADRGYRPMVINMSLGGDTLSNIERQAIDTAIAHGVIVVAAAGNEGEGGVHYPGGYKPVISVGSVGWTGEWLFPSTQQPRYRLWWVAGAPAPAVPGAANTLEGTVDDVYVSDFSSRGIGEKQLDVMAPGSWVRGPSTGAPGYSHSPWWSNGFGDVISGIGSTFVYMGGTSQATPHVAGAAALMLQKNPRLTQAQIESILKSTTLSLPSKGTRHVYDFDHWADISWDTSCDGTKCDPVGAGLVQVDAALAAVR
jgi:subtilisin family serine protease